MDDEDEQHEAGKLVNLNLENREIEQPHHTVNSVNCFVILLR